VAALDGIQGELVDTGEVALAVLAAATPVIMAVTLADMADRVAEEDTKSVYSAQAVASFLDATSWHVRERMAR
jgi:hypothetical protein